jgi:hypothetical protein
MSQGCFIKYNNAYLYGCIKLSEKGTKACYKDVLASKSLLDYYECINLTQKGHLCQSC